MRPRPPATPVSLKMPGDPAAEDFGPVERIFNTHLTVEERVDLGDVCRRHGFGSDHPVLLAVAEVLLFGRRTDERLKRLDDVVGRAERVAARGAGSGAARQKTRANINMLPARLIGTISVVGVVAWFITATLARITIVHQPLAAATFVLRNAPAAPFILATLVLATLLFMVQASGFERLR